MDLNKILQIRQFSASNADFTLEGTVVIYGELQETDKTCPKCGEKAHRPHQYYEKRVRHLPILGNPTYLVFQRKDFICDCGKVFLERLEFQDLKRRCTKAYEEYIYRMARKQDFSSVAESEGVSWDLVEGIFLKGGHTKRVKTQRARRRELEAIACG